MTTTKISSYIWAGLGFACVCASFYSGAIWHLFTAAVCFSMYDTCKSQDERDEQVEEEEQRN